MLLARAPWRRAIGKLLLAVAPWQSAAERRRYGGAFAGWGTVAESHREAFAGRGAVAELLAGSDMAKRMAAPWLRAIGKLLPARGAAAELHREEATAGKEGRATAGKEGRATAGKEGRATAGKESHCRKEEPLPERRTTARKVR